MPGYSIKNKWLSVRRIVLKVLLALFDILAINASFILALFMRFYVANEIHWSAVRFFKLYARYAPVYTAFCLIVFICFRLYDGIWRYAGINDLKRIILANGICFVGHVAGTLLLLQRMPITFYVIGGFLQFVFVAFSRFSYKLLFVEREKHNVGKKDAAIRAMIVGVEGNCRMVLSQLERESTIIPVVILDYNVNGYGEMMDGIPVYHGMEYLKKSIDKYSVNYVIIASNVIPNECRQQIKDTCRELAVEVQDYTSFFQNSGNLITLKSLLEMCNGDTIISIDGDEVKYQVKDEEILRDIEKYSLAGIYAYDNKIKLDLVSHRVVKNDLTEEWAQDQENETGESISFF